MPLRWQPEASQGESLSGSESRTSSAEVPGGTLYREVVRHGSRDSVALVFVPAPPPSEERLREACAMLDDTAKELRSLCKTHIDRCGCWMCRRLLFLDSAARP